MSHPQKITFYLSLVFLLGSSTISQAVVSTPQEASNSRASAIKKPSNKKELRLQRKSVRKAVKSARSGVIKNKKFQIGLLSFTVGFGFSLLSWLITGVAFLGFIGVIGIVIGLVLMVWGFLEYIA